MTAPKPLRTTFFVDGFNLYHSVCRAGRMLNTESIKWLDINSLFRNSLYPKKRLIFAFPFDRKNHELARIAPGSFSLNAESYAKNQLPDRVRLPSGKHVYCPKEWVAKEGGVL